MSLKPVPSELVETAKESYLTQEYAAQRAIRQIVPMKSKLLNIDFIKIDLRLRKVFL